MTAQDVLITPGGQAALSAVFRHLCAPGDPVIVESPTYVGALAAARAAGLILVPVPGDRDGVLPDALADALARSGARLAYLQPRYANPTGRCWRRRGGPRCWPPRPGAARSWSRTTGSATSISGRHHRRRWPPWTMTAT